MFENIIQLNEDLIKHDSIDFVQQRENPKVCVNL